MNEEISAMDIESAITNTHFNQTNYQSFKVIKERIESELRVKNQNVKVLLEESPKQKNPIFYDLKVKRLTVISELVKDENVFFTEHYVDLFFEDRKKTYFNHHIDGIHYKRVLNLVNIGDVSTSRNYSKYYQTKLLLV